MSETTEPGGLSCKLSLPLSWSPCMADEGDAYPQTVEQINLNRLQIILGLGDSTRELHEDDSGVAAELQRLDFKINIVLELVANLVTTGRGVPDPVSVILSPTLLIFDTFKEIPSQGARIELNLFLDLRFPFPLVLQGRVESVRGAAPHPARVGVVLDPVSEPLREMLEKYIFRCHRRHIARLKKSGG